MIPILFSSDIICSTSCLCITGGGGGGGRELERGGEGGRDGGREGGTEGEREGECTAVAVRKRGE